MANNSLEVIKGYIIKHNIETIDKEMIDILSTNESNEEFIKALQNESFRGDKVILKLLAMQDTKKKQQQVREACSINFLREDRKTLIFIASLRDWYQQYQAIIAAKHTPTRRDERVMKLIVSQKTYEEMNEVRVLARRDAIKANQELFRAIVNQDTWQKKEQCRLAAEVDFIRDDKDLMILILNQDTWQQQKQVRESIIGLTKKMPLSEVKFYIRHIAFQDNWEKQRQLYFMYADEKMRNNESLCHMIATQPTANDMNEVRLAALRGEIENIGIIDMISSQDLWQKKEQCRLAAEDRWINRYPEVIRFIGSLATVEAQKKARLYFAEKTLNSSVRPSIEEYKGFLSLKHIGDYHHKHPVIDDLDLGVSKQKRIVSRG